MCSSDLVDTAGWIRGYYDGTNDSDMRKLIKDLRTVLSEPRKDLDATADISVPDDLFDSSWMRERGERQLEAMQSNKVFHDFQFADLRPESGITFVNQAVDDAARAYTRAHYDHGCGLAAADIDRDGLVDLLFLNQVGGNQLWRNLGDGKFENVTDAAGVALADRLCIGAAFADIDNDNDTDLFVTTIRHGNVLFENDGQGHFRDVTREAGLTYYGHSCMPLFFDYNRDGRLDLLVTNMGRFTTDEICHTLDRTGAPRAYYKSIEDAFAGHLFPDRNEPSILFRNEGMGRFRNVTEEVGLAAIHWSGGATPIDINDDGWLDLYILNMQGNDVCLENRRGERFVDCSAEFFPESVWGGMSVKLIATQIGRAHV